MTAKTLERTKTVLCVDDDRLMLGFYRRCLSSYNWKVIGADCARAAIDLVRHRAFDAAIVDINMPDVNGLQLIDKLREMSPNLPVVVVTGLQDHGTLYDSVDAGCDGFLEKPVEPEWLVAQLNSVTSRGVRTKK